MRRRTLALSLLFMLVFIIQPLWGDVAELVFIDAQYESPGSLIIQDLHPSDSIDISEIGQCFKASTDWRPTQVRLALNKLGSPTGIFRAVIFRTEGAYGTNCTPTSTILYQSADLDPAAFPTTKTVVSIDFPSGITLPSGTYAVSLRAISGTIDSSNRVQMYQADGFTSHSGNGYIFVSNAYSAESVNAEDQYFVIIGQIQSGGGAGPGNQPPPTDPGALPTGPLTSSTIIVAVAGLVAIYLFSRGRKR